MGRVGAGGGVDERRACGSSATPGARHGAGWRAAYRRSQMARRAGSEQDVPRLVDARHLGGGGRSRIGMVQAREGAVGARDLPAGGGPGHAQDDVRVDLDHGRGSLAPRRLLSFGPMITKRAARPAKPADPATTVRPRRKAAAKTATVPAATEAPIDNAQLDAAILRFLRRYPNQTVDLTPLAEELKLDPYRLQLAVEDLRASADGRRAVHRARHRGRRARSPRSVLRWLLDSEGGKPSDKPAALKKATKHVRAVRRGRAPSPRRGVRPEDAAGQSGLVGAPQRSRKRRRNWRVASSHAGCR